MATAPLSPHARARWRARVVRPLLSRLRRLAVRAQATLRWSAGFARELRARRRETRTTIGVDASPLWESLTGVGWYLWRLLDALAERDDLRLRLYGPTSIWSDDLAAAVAPLPGGRAIELVSRRVPDDLLLPSGWVIRFLRRIEPLLLALDGNRVLFAPNYFLPRRFRLCRGELVAMIHDLGSIRVPSTLQAETLHDLRRHLESTAFLATTLITPSRAVRREIVDAGLAAPHRVHAVHHGPGQLAPCEPEEPNRVERERLVLFVGTIEPRKDLATLLRAWQAVAKRVPEARLVICGRLGWKSDGLVGYIQALAASGRGEHRGYVGSEELNELYRRCSVVAFPTLYEGFGLPAIEAMSSGAALVASDLPVLREVAGDAAAYAAPGDAHAWADALVTVLNDRALRESLAERGRRRAATFSWGRTAEVTADILLSADPERSAQSD